MKLSLHPTVLYRIPKFSIQANLTGSWEELKTAISLSSTEFFQVVKDVKKEDLPNLPPATKNTIWKYFNRARFRATPYATFASVGLCEIKNRPESPNLILEETPLIHTFTDWSHKEDIVITREQIENQDLLLFANSSHYPIGDGIRYISRIDGAFQLSEIDRNELAEEILHQTKAPIRYSILSQILKAKGHATPAVLDLITELIDLQLLLSSQHPNIIGEDYFKRINIPIEKYPNQYLLSERNLQSGQLDASLFKDLPEAVSLLHKLIPQNDPEPLQQFISRFSRKFEGQQIPLMQALDPEQGVGYGDFESAGENDELVSKFASRKNNNTSDAKDKFQQLMLRQILEGSLSSTHIIQLDQLKPLGDEKTENGNNNPAPAPLPNSIGVLLSLADEYICIDSIGGTTANTLLGRFTLTGEHFHQHCQNIASLEQQANPEILFFDVAYIAEGKVDNVNRRKAIYPLQLSILNFDTSANPLTLDDLLVYVQGGQLMLRSKKLNKRLIPRFSTAYNYSRSDLSLFRFFCDLQNQGIQTSLNLNLRSIVPNAPYYPRIQYKNIILAPASWKISDSDLPKNKLNPTDTAALLTLLKDKGVSPIFKAGSADQTLRYDRQNTADMENFLIALRKQKIIYVEEAFATGNSPVKDPQQQPYHCQLLMSLSHQEPIYKDFPMLEAKTPAPGIQKNIAPGKDWLYFEIYCHQQRSVALLLGPVSYLLNTYKDHIKKWFFINYNENGDHLRLRLQLKDQGQSHPITAALNELLDEEIQNGIISDLQIKTYKRETHRYGWETIQDIESHFCTDSHYSLQLLEAEISDTDKYHLCISLMQDIQGSGAISEKELSYVTGKVSNSFNQEHQLQPTDFKELNNLYRTYKAQQPSTPDLLQQQNQTGILQSFIHSLSLFPGIEKRSILTDLFHMHVNRLFSSNQRTHEMIIYYLLIKENQRQTAQKTTRREPLHLQHNPI